MSSDKDHTEVSLGDELLAQIFAFLPARELACAEASCTHWLQLIQTSALWQRLTENTWQEHRKEWWAGGVNWRVKSQKAWKSIYVSMLATWRVLPKQKTAVKYLTGHTQAITCLAASFYTIASGSADKTVRLWDRKTGACRHILQLLSHPSALHLLSDELVVVTYTSSCSVWKGSRCLRSICPHLSVPPPVINSSHICASAVSDNLLFLVFKGINSSNICALAVSDNLLFLVFKSASTIQVWDLYSGLQVQIFRPKLSVGSMEDHYITALAAGTLHGHQILVAGICSAALESRVLVLHQSDGQLAASPIPLPSGRWATMEVWWVTRIIYEDGVAVATMKCADVQRTHTVPVQIHLSKAKASSEQRRPVFTARSTRLSPECNSAGRSHSAIWRLHTSAPAHLAATPIFVSIQRGNYPHPMRLQFVFMAKDSRSWYKYCPAVTAGKPETGSQDVKPTPHTTQLADLRKAIVLRSCGLLLTTASNHQVAVWQFPSFPDE